MARKAAAKRLASGTGRGSGQRSVAREPSPPQKTTTGKKAPAKKAPTKNVAPAKKASPKEAAERRTASTSRATVNSLNARPTQRTRNPLPAPKSGKLPRNYRELVVAAQASLVLPAPDAIGLLPFIAAPNRGDSVFLGVIAGTGSTTGTMGAGATDLCEISPSGQVALAGDTFSGNAAYDGVWSASMGLHVQPGSLSDVVRFDRSFGGRSSLYAEAPPPVPGGSQLPAGTIQVFGIDYALITRTANLVPIDSRLVRIDPNGPHWPTVPGSWRPADWQWGNQTQISGYHAPDGWVYIVADGFARDKKIFLYRTRAENFLDRNTWHAWGMIGGGPDWGWDVEPTPITDSRFGELSFRLIEGKAVLSGFNWSSGNIEVWVADDPTQVFNGALTVIATQQSVPQNYGGYIVPGSTLDQALILVSQWNTALNNPYNVQEFVANLNR